MEYDLADGVGETCSQHLAALHLKFKIVLGGSGLLYSSIDVEQSQHGDAQGT